MNERMNVSVLQLYVMIACVSHNYSHYSGTDLQEEEMEL